MEINISHQASEEEASVVLYYLAQYVGNVGHGEPEMTRLVVNVPDPQDRRVAWDPNSRKAHEIFCEIVEHPDDLGPNLPECFYMDKGEMTPVEEDRVFLKLDDAYGVIGQPTPA